MTKFEIKKIIHNNYNLSEHEAERVAAKMLQEYDFETENDVIELTDIILGSPLK